ncbi:MAG: tRNA epoxyqueuosine(34) reductase QueG [Chitinophagales bacterium]|nr:tRNA epoxyqueuosine(34) reductase QueG [Chitinophagales bacterium]
MSKAIIHTEIVKETAKRFGFDEVGISIPKFLDEEAYKVEQWLKQGHHGEMDYMANHFDVRLDPTKLLPGAKSIISLSYNYFPKQTQNPKAPKLAKYAYGKDYHKVIKKKLKQLVQELQEKIGNFHARIFTDSAPILERVWAEKSGLGWVGKNTLLLTKGKGSFFFLAEIVCDLELIPDGPVKNYCGTCTKCIDACPTQALYAPYKMDASKCISYLTIELKNQIPEHFKGKMENWMYGCDICQDVCPINARATPHQEEKFIAKNEVLDKTKQEWQEITEEIFDTLFEGSAVKRTKFEGLKRNIGFLG